MNTDLVSCQHMLSVILIMTFILDMYTVLLHAAPFHQILWDTDTGLMHAQHELTTDLGQ